MSERDYSGMLAVEIQENLQAPIDGKLVEPYQLKRGMRTPFTNYQIVKRKPEWEVGTCNNCKFDFLVKPNNPKCPLCGTDLRMLASVH